MMKQFLSDLAFVVKKFGHPWTKLTTSLLPALKHNFTSALHNI